MRLRDVFFGVGIAFAALSAGLPAHAQRIPIPKPSFAPLAPEPAEPEILDARAVDPRPALRYVSLKSGRANLRRGPSTEHAIEWVYRGYRRLPLKVVAETGNWRQVEDHEGVRGWMHRSLLTGARTVRVTGLRGGERLLLHRGPAADTPAFAFVEPGALGGFERCRDGWCRVRFETAEHGRLTGWLPAARLWGLMPRERG